MSQKNQSPTIPPVFYQCPYIEFPVCNVDSSPGVTKYSTSLNNQSPTIPPAFYQCPYIEFPVCGVHFHDYSDVSKYSLSLTTPYLLSLKTKAPEILALFAVGAVVGIVPFMFESAYLGVVNYYNSIVGNCYYPEGPDI